MALIYNKQCSNNLKKARLFNNLSNPNNKSIAEAGRKAGYKRMATLYSPGMKADIRKFLESRSVSREELNQQFKSILEIALDSGDLTNGLRSLEALARMSGLFHDKDTKTNVAVFQQFKSDLPKVIQVDDISPLTDKVAD
jgi:hypothetical protein